MTLLAEGAAQAHEVFTACVNAGFTRAEALKIVIAAITASAGQAGQPWPAPGMRLAGRAIRLAFAVPSSTERSAHDPAVP